MAVDVLDYNLAASTAPAGATPSGEKVLHLGRIEYPLTAAVGRVADDPERLLRVQVARLSLDYVKLQLAARLLPLVGEQEKRPVEDWYHRAMEEFFATAERGGVGHMREAGRPHSTMEAYRRLLETGSYSNEDLDAVIE